MNTYSTNVEKWAVICKDVGNSLRRRCPRPTETREAIHSLITALGVFTCEAMELSEPGPADQWRARYSDIPDTTLYSLYAVHPPSAARPVWAGGRYVGQTLTVPVFTDGDDAEGDPGRGPPRRPARADRASRLPHVAAGGARGARRHAAVDPRRRGPLGDARLGPGGRGRFRAVGGDCLAALESTPSPYTRAIRLVGLPKGWLGTAPLGL